MSALRVVFMGTAPLACPSLEALTKEQSLEVVAVVTRPDRPKGRELKLQPSPVKELAQQKNLTVLQPEKARDEAFVGELAAQAPELIVVAAYGQILPQSILQLPRFNCLNVHASLLPAYRGAAPIQWALLNGDNETGVTLMKMDEGLDTGDIITQEALPIIASDNSQTLHDKLARLGADLLVRTIPEYVTGSIVPRCQSSFNASFAPKITKEDGRLDWVQPAVALWNRIRAFTPWPGTFTHYFQHGRQRFLKIWDAAPIESMHGQPGQILVADKSGIVIACGTGALRVLSVQLEGSRRMTVAEFLSGHSLDLREKFGG